MSNTMKLFFTIFFIFNSFIYADELLEEKELEYLKNKKIIKVCINPDWMPIEFREDEKPQGISIDTLNIVANKLEVKLQFIKTNSWKQSQRYLKYRKCDVLPSAVKTDERSKYALFTKVYLKYDLAIITKDDKLFVNNFKDIVDKPMSRKEGSGLISNLKEKYPNIDIKEVSNFEEAFNAVENDDVYFTIATIPVLSYYKNKYGLKDLQVSGYMKNSYNLSMAVRDDDKILYSAINKALINIPKETHRIVNDKWAIQTVIKRIDYELIWKIVGVFFSIMIIFIAFLLRQNSLTRQLNEQKNELLKTNENFDLGQGISKIGIWDLDYDTNHLEWSIGVHQIFGTNSETFKATFEAFMHYVHPMDRNNLIKVYNNSIINKTNYFIEHRVLMDDGTIKYVEERCHNFFNKDGDILKSIGTVLDITLRREAELKLEYLNKTLEEKIKYEVEKNREKDKQMLQQSKLAQMGEMISMIAHQWRQPLTAIGATTNNLLFKLVMDQYDKKEFEKEISLISDYSQHLSKTIDDFRGFFKTNKSKENTTLEEIVTSTINIIKPSIINQDILLSIEINCKSSINTYPNEIKQVVLNLIKNAEDVLKEKKIRNPSITILTKCINKKRLIIVKDNAGGIPNEIIDKIFEPYFSTKLEKDGTGLGLYMSKIIIEEHCNGILNVTNDKDGAVFTIEFREDS